MRQAPKIFLIALFYVTFCSSNDGYVLSGKVVGLYGGNLILANNESDSLEIKKDGYFQFGKKLKDGDSFKVSISDEPCEQSCKIENGQGSIDGMNFENIRVVCLVKTWTTAHSLFSSTPFEKISTHVEKVLMNKKGNMLVLWGTSTEESYSLKKHYISRYVDGIWIHPNVENDIGYDLQNSYIYDPRIVFNDNDEFGISWAQVIDYHYVIYFKKNSTDFSTAPELLTSNVSGTSIGLSTFYDLALNNTGNILFSWIGKDAQMNDRIYWREFENRKWNTSPSLENGIYVFGVGQINPEIELNDHGDAVVFWYNIVGEDDDQTIQIFKSERNNKEWINPTSYRDDFASIGKYSQSKFNVVMNSLGNILVFWSQKYDQNFSNLHVAQRLGGVWNTYNSESIFPTDINNTDNIIDETPALSFSDNGDAILTWQTIDSYGKVHFYKSEKRQGRWDWPIDKNDFVLDEKYLCLTPAIDEFGNSNLSFIFFPNLSVFDLVTRQYKQEYWHPDKSFEIKQSNDTIADQIDPPQSVARNCRQALFWKEKFVSYDTFYTIYN